jgi:hypothetical protein
MHGSIVPFTLAQSPELCVLTLRNVNYCICPNVSCIHKILWDWKENKLYILALLRATIRTEQAGFVLHMRSHTFLETY